MTDFLAEWRRAAEERMCRQPSAVDGRPSDGVADSTVIAMALVDLCVLLAKQNDDKPEKGKK